MLSFHRAPLQGIWGHILYGPISSLKEPLYGICWLDQQYCGLWVCYLGSLKGGSKSAQVLFDGIQAVLVLVLASLKCGVLFQGLGGSGEGEGRSGCYTTSSS